MTITLFAEKSCKRFFLYCNQSFIVEEAGFHARE
jgi:hypothetical protein